MQKYELRVFLSQPATADDTTELLNAGARVVALPSEADVTAAKAVCEVCFKRHPTGLANIFVAQTL